MLSSDLGELAEVLYPITSKEARRGLTASALRGRYQSLPDDTRDLLKTICREVGSNWRPGRAFRQWEEDLEALGRRVDPAVDDSRDGDESPERMPEFDGSILPVSESIFSLRGDSIERRAEQVAMAKDIAGALEQQAQVIVEAGTGIGKTLAYLAPLAVWALASGETGIVSTYTKVLQEQVLDKEVSTLRRLLERVLPGAGEALSVVVVKGRSNYLCKGALERACGEASDPVEASFLARLAVWSSFTETGDRAELSLTKEQEQRFYTLLAAGWRCSERLCRYYRDDECFLPRLRQRARAAHIVVTNHALLTAERDMKDLLPKAWALVVDEAHEVENAATSMLTNEMPRTWMSGPLSRVYRPGLKRDYGIATDLPEIEPRIKRRLRELVSETQGELGTLYDAIEAFAKVQPEVTKKQLDMIRLTGGKQALPDWKRIKQRWTYVRANIEAICRLLFDLDMCYLTIACDDLAEAQRLVEITGYVTMTERRLRERCAALDAAIRNAEGTVISWVQLQRQNGIAVMSAPLSVAEELKKVWKAYRSGALTGATLATDQDFDFLCGRVGYQSTFEARYRSPFDYANRTRLYLLTDMPDGSTVRHNEAAARAISRLATATNGRTMVLFTSFVAMHHVATAVEGDLRMAGLKLVVQGRDRSPADVVDALRGEERVVAFGVASMWNGVDVSGDRLSQLIIARLPFPFTAHPIHEARAECYQNGFGEFTLPQTILQFRQGFGRLMRKESDRGVVVVLDGRVESKPYGQAFVECVFPPHGQPAKWIRRVSVPEAAREIGTFLDAVPISS